MLADKVAILAVIGVLGGGGPAIDDTGGVWLPLNRNPRRNYFLPWQTELSTSDRHLLIWPSISALSPNKWLVVISSLSRKKKLLSSCRGEGAKMASMQLKQRKIGNRGDTTLDSL